jgi:quinoprotein glucose dehydrogenase
VSTPPTAATAEQRGSRLYHETCTFCHGLNRKGNPPLYPALTGLRKSRDELRAILVEGRGIMPAFTQFSSGQVEEILDYLQRDGEPVEPDENRIPAGAGPSIPRYAQIAPFFEDPHGVPAISPPWGTLNAVDLNRGEILWKVPLGEYPHLAAMGIRDTGAKNFGGPVLTAGGLIFIAATPDEKIRAFDKYTGRILWEHGLPAGGYATPSVYMIRGRQYVAIAAGGGGKLATPYGDSIIAFALTD